MDLGEGTGLPAPVVEVDGGRHRGTSCRASAAASARWPRPKGLIESCHTADLAMGPDDGIGAQRGPCRARIITDASSVRDDTVSFPKIFVRCISTVFSATDSRRAIARLV